MKYTDEIYGEVEIDEPVILEIMNSPFFERLKGISNGGYNFEKLVIDRKTHQYNRFSHSVGCYILVKKFGASLEEKIAALIHDISHTVFSHCIDYALSSMPEKSAFQDNEFINYINKTDIPSILKKYNFDIDYVLDQRNFSLQERDTPALCADRIDNNLRLMILDLGYDLDRVNYFLDNLIVANNVLAFKNKEVAREFIKDFMRISEGYIAGKPTAIMFFTNSNYIKYSLDKKYIEYDDLFTTEKFVIEKINKNIENDKNLEYLWEEMNSSFLSFSFDEKDYDRKMVCKSPTIDPLFIDGNTLRKISEIDQQYKEELEINRKPKVYFVKYLK